MAKTFGFDPARRFAARLFPKIPVETTTTSRRRRPHKTRFPVVPPPVRGLPWSKMLRSFREKSA